MTDRGQIITFYSYKGGTGRTMALANTAVLLARKQRGDVLVMDWDLEAPGLHRYFEGQSRFGDQPGTIDLLEDLAALFLYSGQDPEEQLAEDQTLERVRELDLNKYVLRVDESLSVVWAGCSEADDYARRISEFDWTGLYRRVPYLFTSLATVLAERYESVCVDSRTGVSDTSGVCTALLPEKLVVVFTPNLQSLDGALSRARSAVTYRRQSGDLRPLVVYPLASRVELSEAELRRQWRYGDKERGSEGYQTRFESLFRDIYALPECNLQAWFDEVQIQQTTRYAYGEEIAVAGEGSTTDRLSLAQSYVSFTRVLEESDGPWKLERQMDTRRDADREQERIGMDLLQNELAWHDHASQRGRMRLFMIRAYQVIVFIGAVVASFVLSSTNQSWLWASLVAGLGTVGALEGFAAMVGATQWRRHATLAGLLADEEYRFEARTRQYADASDRGKLLAERVDEILSETYRKWEDDKTPFGGLAPIPQRPDRFRQR